MERNKNLTPYAQDLRNQMTKEERRLWYSFLRNHPVQFKRQAVCGNYILDFYCPLASLAIELDGSQHAEPEGLEKDSIRTEYLNSYGIYVLRIPNRRVWVNFRGVCEGIDDLVQKRSGVVWDC
jgi:very-short-patch-repair endonuclease